jgi:hypothetical protein
MNQLRRPPASLRRFRIGTTALERKMPTSVEDIIESATVAVLRALDARRAGAAGQSQLDTAQLLRSGLFVDIRIRAGGFPPFPGPEVELNPQPLPPKE